MLLLARFHPGVTEVLILILGKGQAPSPMTMTTRLLLGPKYPIIAEVLAT